MLRRRSLETEKVEEGMKKLIQITLTFPLAHIYTVG